MVGDSLHTDILGAQAAGVASALVARYGFFAGQDVDSAIEILEAHNVPCAPILSVAETVTHPHLVQRGTVRTITDRIAGEFQIPGNPLRFSAFPETPDYVAATLGEHNREILREVLGKDAATIDSLYADGVLIEKPV